jgi:L,D-transpeptidase-like protein/sporulation and spore germination protein
MRGAVLGVGLVVLLLLPAQAGAAVGVWFVRDGEPVAVQRNAKGPAQALRSLLKGPTAPERKRGIHTTLPAAVPLRGLVVQRRVVTVDLGSRIAAPARDAVLRQRVRQVVRTLDGVSGVLGVRVRVEGGVPIGLFPGLDLRGTVTARALPDEPGRSPRALEQRLDDLGFLPPRAGMEDHAEWLSVGILAFEKWSGLPRDGALSQDGAAVLRRAVRPEPLTRSGRGRRIEVSLDRQVALLIEHDRVLRVVHISTGAWGTSTPSGSFRVYRKERYSWSVPFKVWMPWASYFTGGIAFHEYSYVPAYPASHGCVRVNRFDARYLFAFAVTGTPVQVVWRS